MQNIVEFMIVVHKCACTIRVFQLLHITISNRCLYLPSFDYFKNDPVNQVQYIIPPLALSFLLFSFILSTVSLVLDQSISKWAIIIIHTT